MNNLLTIVFNSFHSEKLFTKILKNLKQYKILIIENSLNNLVKINFEKKYKNVKVIIPKKNLGLAAGYNLGIKKSKTKYVFLNNPDIEISNLSINKLLDVAKKIKEFAILSPTYKNETIHKNYSKYEIKINKNLSSVRWIDNNFLIDKSQIKKQLFDENFFLYFETIDFCLNLYRKNKKLFVMKNIKFKHYGSKSVDVKFNNLVTKTRAWHYSWSKFYYYKKNFNYIYALSKIIPNLLRALKHLFLNIFKLNFNNFLIHLLEIYGIVCSILCLPSFYRAKN